jgi:hypothetical protein
LPDVVLARGRGRVGGVQPFGDLPTTQLFSDSTGFSGKALIGFQGRHWSIFASQLVVTGLPRES